VIQRSSFDRVRGAVVGTWAIATIGAFAACGGHASSAAQPGATQPAGTARATVQTFMRAVADSNLIKMAELWGTSKGPAATTGQPADYQHRIVLIQSYLRSDDYRITADVGDGDSRRSMQVELRRQACTWIIPFSLVKSDHGGWIINSIDLTRAGNPVRPCDPNAQDSTGHH
jgi:hypothetical protein